MTLLQNNPLSTTFIELAECRLTKEYERIIEDIPSLNKTNDHLDTYLFLLTICNHFFMYFFT